MSLRAYTITIDTRDQIPLKFPDHIVTLADRGRAEAARVPFSLS